MERYLAVATGRCKTHSRLFNSSVVLSMDLIHFRTMDLIKIAPYDPSWIAKFAAEKQRLQEHLSDLSMLEIRHFGSTAIPHMPAKPIIDILVAVESVDEARASFPPILDKLGYDFWRDNRKHDRLFFVRGMPPRGVKRTHHIHVCERPSEVWNGILFCDYLVKHPEAAREYAMLKRRMSELHRHDREAYTNAKKSFVAKIMGKAIH
ncbi:GrpB family protein [Parasphingorhabdus sp.]|uniref:GrpB family protein n=1 Tax=Parasphingorhabdus sp. TaxID=2709688 RepID=UPI003D28EBD3